MPQAPGKSILHGIVISCAVSLALLNAENSVSELWDDSRPVLKKSEMPLVEGTRFSVIKPYEFDKDGYRFLHGVALAWHKGKLFASFANNKEGENTGAEEIRCRISEDDGKTWGDIMPINREAIPGIAVSHGVFLSHQDTLWSFNAAYTGHMSKVHTRAYVYDESRGIWEPKGIVVEGGFWPLQEPTRMQDGNWIMAGIHAAEGTHSSKNAYPAAVAISHGDDLTRWDLVVIPAPAGLGMLQMWGESGVIVNGKHVINIARYGAENKALMAVSNDFGRTWTESRPSNLPMAASKPYTGTLSNGQNYLIGTTAADCGAQRTPLTIAVTRPGESVFRKIYVIRRSVLPEGPGESHPSAYLSYPYAVENNGNLYVGYSNSGGKVGRAGTGAQQINNNSAELAVFPIDSLRVK